GIWCFCQSLLIDGNLKKIKDAIRHHKCSVCDFAALGPENQMKVGANGNIAVQDERYLRLQVRQFLLMADTVLSQITQTTAPVNK
ncbi:hypothetical protein, partial [Persicitalea sp.]|uniref:hypothetical protein n=1 Tax=Persicitalea sp. TaxID=3100273 RepID=UPI0035932C41